MNTNMYENPILQDNLKILRRYDYEVIDPAVGYLACGDTGAGENAGAGNPFTVYPERNCL